MPIPRGTSGGTAEALAGADVLVGLSSALLPEKLVLLLPGEEPPAVARTADLGGMLSFYHREVA